MQCSICIGILLLVTENLFIYPFPPHTRYNSRSAQVRHPACVHEPRFFFFFYLLFFVKRSHHPTNRFSLFSVVGPNGSGKSNVIDALLFVFGYRANKMRQGKLSELIHSSANFPNLDMCGVEVHFQEIIDLVRLNPIEDRSVSRFSTFARHLFLCSKSLFHKGAHTTY